MSLRPPVADGDDGGCAAGADDGGCAAGADDCGCAEQFAGSGGHGPIRSLDPRLRLVICAAFALVVVGLAHLPSLLAAFGLAVAAAFAARLAPGLVLRRLAALDGFMLLVLVFLPFSMPGSPLLEIGGFAASREGLQRAIEILLKSNAVVLMIQALLATMEPTELGHAMGRLGLPAKFVHLFLFTVRYIDLLGREYRRLRTAMRARGFCMRCDLHTWRSIGYLFGMLLVRSIERSERILAAMRCRGFDGRFRPLAETAAVGRRERAFAGLSVIAGLALVTLEHL